MQNDNDDFSETDTLTDAVLPAGDDIQFIRKTGGRQLDLFILVKSPTHADRAEEL